MTSTLPMAGGVVARTGDWFLDLERDRVMIMATMNDFLLFNAAVDANGTITAPFPMGLQNNAVSITLVIISGTTATSGALQVQFSNDGVSWSPVVSGGTSFDGKTGPQMITASVLPTTGVPRFARIVLKGPATNVCIVNLTANPYQA
jgi:hypothetical protein